MPAAGEQGRLAVGSASSAASHPFVPAVLRRFRESVPGVAVTLEEAGTSELVDAILHERARRGLRALAGGPAPPGCCSITVLEEPMLAALPAGHPLAADAGALPLRRRWREAVHSLPPPGRAGAVRRRHPDRLPRSGLQPTGGAGSAAPARHAEPGGGRRLVFLWCPPPCAAWAATTLPTARLPGTARR
ncbi:LysR substrate-binding domain-containing protein [Cupriavidus basilensis]